MSIQPIFQEFWAGQVECPFYNSATVCRTCLTLLRRSGLVRTWRETYKPFQGHRFEKLKTIREDCNCNILVLGPRQWLHQQVRVSLSLSLNQLYVHFSSSWHLCWLIHQQCPKSLPIQRGFSGSQCYTKLGLNIEKERKFGK